MAKAHTRYKSFPNSIVRKTTKRVWLTIYTYKRGREVVASVKKDTREKFYRYRAYLPTGVVMEGVEKTRKMAEDAALARLEDENNG